MPWYLRPEAKLLLGSLVLVAVLWGVTRLLRRLPLARLLPGAAGNPIRIVARTQLGTKESICLIDVNATPILLAITAQTISTLHVWPQGGSTAGPGTGPTAPRYPAETGGVPGQLRSLQTWLGRAGQ